MTFWVTTHWPRRVGDTPGDSPGIWVAEGRQQVISRIAPGDLVWSYESQSGRTAKRIRADGTTELLPCTVGRQGIVALLEVLEPAFAKDDVEPEEYTDGTTLWWRWYAPTRTINSAGYVPRQTAARLLGYRDAYVFRGFGEAHSGLKEIQRSEFESVQAAFVDSTASRDDKSLRRAEASIRHGGIGGEGPIHRQMKHLLATNPAEVLNEPGLEHIRTEYPFATNDRIDVLLRDAHGRFVAVEIEPDCAESEVAGPLQCMKYRALLAYTLDRRATEIRSILLSRSIHPNVCEKCLRYDVEPRIMSIDSSLSAPELPPCLTPLAGDAGPA